VTLHTVFDK